MAESSMKQQKAAAAEDDTDRISSLPDSMLCHIMSFLPTKTSIATMSLVSPMWRNLWKHLQVFDFTYTWPRNDNFRKFAFYVNAVLSIRKSRDIRKMHLVCDIDEDFEFNGNCVKMWLRAAIGPCLEELSLMICTYNGDQRFLLSPSLFMDCTNLVSLSLSGEIQMKVQHSSVHFPSLKRLTLDFDIVDSEVALLSGCPILERLDLHFGPTSLIEAPVPPSSKRLKFTYDSFAWTYLEIFPEDVIDERITLGILGNLQSMVESYLDIFSPRESKFVNPLLDLLRDNYIYDDTYEYGLAHIRLHRSTTKWPLRTPDLNYREFYNLHYLKFILPCFNSNLLLNVLQKCHKLQFLIIQSNEEGPSPLTAWEPQSTIVPKCLKSHLNHIHIEGYQGFEDELAFAEYILRNGLVLKTMLIFVDTSIDLTKKYRSLKRLTDIPKGSFKCQLKFDPAVSS